MSKTAKPTLPEPSPQRTEHSVDRANGGGAQELESLYDYLMKIIVVGESGTGKTCLLHSLIHGRLPESSGHTVGVEFSSKTIKIGTGSRRKRIKLQLWDTAGQERFRSVCRSYYRGAAGAMLVFDISDRNSFKNIQDWLTDVRSLASPHVQIILIGAKRDVGDSERQVPQEEGSDWARQNALQNYIEVSAKSGENIGQAFSRLAETILTKIELGEIDPSSHGSGIQYGDIGLTNLHARQRTLTPSSRWVPARLSEVFGIDIDRRNRGRCRC